MKPRASDAWLLQYSGEHLLHELKMFWYLVEAIPSQKDAYLHDATVESFVQHLRNLIWFFCKKAQFDDDVTAADFLDDPREWKERESPTLQAARLRANKELNHLTRDRKNLGDPLKDWKIGELFQEIAGVAKKFDAKASDKKLHPDVRALLKS